jgi:hypothetical protein
MTLRNRDKLQRAQWEAYMARQNESLFDRIWHSPVTFVICLAALCALPVIAVIFCLGC